MQSSDKGMKGQKTASRDSRYDRQLLLGGAKRNAVLGLWEIQRYGLDSYGDADYVSIFGMPPAKWYAKGVRLLGRTAVECTRDALGNAIGRDISAIAAAAPSKRGAMVVDPFVGSGNTLYWILRHLPGVRGLGFEVDPFVFQLTSQNLATLTLPLEILKADYLSGLTDLALPVDQLLITFIAPPWGDALSMTGLDLRLTTPPIGELLDFLIERFRCNTMLCAIQVYETVDSGSLAELTPRFDWSETRIYDLNAPGSNHGIMIGTRGWVP